MTVDRGRDPEDREELIQLYLDERLSPERRLEVERLLKSDPDARRMAKALDSVKRALRSTRSQAPVPDATREAIQTLIDREKRRRLHRGLAWLAAAAAILLAVLLGWPEQDGPGPLPSLVAADFTQYLSNQLPLPIVTGNADELERRFDESLRHSTRVFDLSAMDFELLGGRIHRVGDRPAALFVYRDGSGDVYVCEMTPGSLQELPEGGLQERLQNDGTTFLVYRRSPGLTLVYWQEGDTVCVLTSNAPRDQVLALAFAKAAEAQRTA